MSNSCLGDSGEPPATTHINTRHAEKLNFQILTNTVQQHV